MAQFRGVLQGGRGEVSRLGHKSTGLSATLASWQGAVSVRLWHDSETDTDMAEVTLQPWHGSGISAVLYRGPVSGAPVVASSDARVAVERGGVAERGQNAA